jgi:hypothetical protein
MTHKVAAKYEINMDCSEAPHKNKYTHNQI